MLGIEAERKEVAPATIRFMETFEEHLAGDGLDWPPVPALVALESMLIRDQDVGDDYPAIVATMRQAFVALRAKLASMN